MKPIQYLNNLTPLRGIAAILTVIFHVDLMLGNGGDMLIKHTDSFLLSRMYLMVDFFFILSGFIMCHVYGEMFSHNVNKASFKKFTIARFARVYPLHVFTLFYCVVLFFITNKLGIPKVPVLQIENNTSSIISNVLLLHSMNLHNWFSWDHASWSISVEWWAYMLFPFLVKPFFKLNKMGIATVAILCFVGYLVITFFIVPIVTFPPEIPFVKEDTSLHTINVAYQFGYIRCLCGFVLGMMMYQAYKMEWGKKILGNGYLLIAFALCSFICMHFNLPDIITVSFFPFILMAGAYGSTGMNKVFGSKPLQKLGDWSFSIYLIHQPLMFTLASILSYLNPADPSKIQTGPPPKPEIFIGWLICISFISVTIFISYLTYRFIEVPARNWINPKRNK